MIHRPPACERHAADLPGKAMLVDRSECPWCWSEQREGKHVTDAADPLACWCRPYRDTERSEVIIHRPEGTA